MTEYVASAEGFTKSMWSATAAEIGVQLRVPKLSDSNESLWFLAFMDFLALQYTLPVLYSKPSNASQKTIFTIGTSEISVAGRPGGSFLVVLRKHA